MTWTATATASTTATTPSRKTPHSPRTPTATDTATILTATNPTPFHPMKHNGLTVTATGTAITSLAKIQTSSPPTATSGRMPTATATVTTATDRTATSSPRNPASGPTPTAMATATILTVSSQTVARPSTLFPALTGTVARTATWTGIQTRTKIGPLKTAPMPFQTTRPSGWTAMETGMATLLTVKTQIPVLGNLARQPKPSFQTQTPPRGTSPNHRLVALMKTTTDGWTEPNRRSWPSIPTNTLTATVMALVQTPTTTTQNRSSKMNRITV